MGAMKRELERLAEIVIYGTPETMTREMNKVAGLADGGAVAVLAYAVEMAREITPLCECGAALCIPTPFVLRHVFAVFVVAVVVLVFARPRVS